MIFIKTQILPIALFIIVVLLIGNAYATVQLHTRLTNDEAAIVNTLNQHQNAIMQIVQVIKESNPGM